ncbi:odorant receptor 7a-like [Musca vetustissima]|uniref:odorant receptor 7a-like n=1 Tax=Musca vetustissima TaxID=27455 RepID=UPI002AB643A7|nr:odorant receptor 7a-like [Musca vetustissima]
MFQQLWIAAFTLCLTAINLMAFERTFAEKIFSVVYLVVILIQIFPACLCVTFMMSETSNLTTAMYNCNWIEQNHNFRRMLIIFMQRSQKINVIYAGGLAPVTLQTFLSIIKFSFSMYTILSQMKI